MSRRGPSREPGRGLGAPDRLARLAALARPAQLARFGTVGSVAFVVDAGLFNLLRFGPGAVLETKPVTAKVVSVAVATLVAWLGNRYWAFADSRRENRVGELVAFGAVNLGGMVIAAGCLAVSHYALGLTSPLADNISANGVGLALGTAFRYAAYRWLVFTGGDAAALPPPALPEEEPHPGQGAVGLRSGTARTRPAGAAPG